MTIHFNDISHYQGTSFPISGPIIAKATEGSNFTDSAYASNKKRTLAAGHPFAAYHFPLRAATASMEAQAAHAKAVIGTDTPTMMDIEKDINGHWITRDDCLRQIDIMQASGMRVTMAYIPKWFWEGEWDGASLTPFADRGLVLVSSQYVHTYSDSGPGWDAYGGVKPGIWQYTDGKEEYAGGGLHNADTNAFKGTEAELGLVFQNGNREDDPMTAAEFLALLKDPQVNAYFKAVAWQYSGGGIDLASTLAAMNAASKAANDADIAALEAKIDELTAKVDALTPGTISGDLSVTGTLHVTEA